MNDKSEIQTYFGQPVLVDRFQQLAGNQATGYIQSVILAVDANPQLAKCTYESISHEALRAAMLGLSCDPVTREAQLVPRFNGKKKQWEAHLEPHYMGLYKLAVRTNKYWTINVTPVMKHQTVKVDRSGTHWVFEGGMRIDHFQLDRITAKNIKDVRGWLGYFKMKNGFEKTVYMTVEEIMEHARAFSASYQNDLKKGWKTSPWSKPEILPTMQMKTVLKELLKWADTTGSTGEMLKEALEAEGDTVDAEFLDSDLADPDLDPDKDFPLEEPSIQTDALGAQIEPEEERIVDKAEPEETVDALMGTKKSKKEPVEYDKTRTLNVMTADAINLLVGLGIFENSIAAAKVVSQFTPKKTTLGKLVAKSWHYRGARDNNTSVEDAIKQANEYKGEK